MSGDVLSSVWSEPNRRPVLSLRDWEALLGQARQSRLLARLALHYFDRGWLSDVPAAVLPHLEGGMRLAARQQHEVRWEADCISRALACLSTPVVLLKGAAYVMASLPPARGRLFADIDIMVDQKNIGAVESALFGAGWISDERDEYNQRYYRQWMHEIPPLRHVQRNTFIDLHHTITPPTSRFNVDGKILHANKVAIDGFPGLYVLAPVDMVLHSAVHLFQDGEFSYGMRDLLDLNDLLLHFGLRETFWPELLERSEVLGLGIPLYHALFHIKRLLGTSLPSHFVDRLEGLGPNKLTRFWMAWALGLALQPRHPSSSSHWSGLARWLLFVRSHMLRMPFYLVIPHLVRKAWMRRFPKEPHTEADIREGLK